MSFKILDRICDRAFAGIGALVFSQAPAYLKQYQDHIEGHLSELGFLLEQVGKLALKSRASVEQYVQRFLSDQDPIVQGQETLLHQLSERWDVLNQSYHQLTSASASVKPLMFFYYFNPDIARETLGSFQPSLPLTMEAGAYALTGLFAGCFFYFLLKKIILGLTCLLKRVVHS